MNRPTAGPAHDRRLPHAHPTTLPTGDTSVRNPADPVRVLIVDDHEMIQEYLRSVLDAHPDLAGFTCVGAAATGRAAVRLARERNAELVVLDLCLPDMDGVEVARQLRDLRPGMRILVLAERDDDERVGRLVRLGIDGYLPKVAGLADVVAALRAVAAGRLHLSGAARHALTLTRAPDEPTSREWEVLDLLMDGYSNRVIAAALGITSRTVAFHLGNLFAKFGVSSRTELVCRARQRHRFPG